MTDEERLINRLVDIGLGNSEKFYSLMELVLQELRILENDDRICYALPENQVLGLNIGQNCWIMFQNTNQYNYFDSSGNGQEWFDQHDSFTVNEIENILNLALDQLAIAGFNYGSSPALKKSLFDINYKSEIFQKAFNVVKFLDNINNNEEESSENSCIELNQIFFGPPGTGKTYNTINEAIKIAAPEFYTVNHENRDKLKMHFKELLLNNDNESEGQIGFTTFHQSMSYEDFIEGIKPVKPDTNDTHLKYEIQEGIFKRICRIASDNSNKNFVIIIDEINRGNVSSIFGELITLIEKDKRAGTDEELSVLLPYSKKEFKVPQNVFIIGTMNTADRSIEALDTALRRRFSFREMPPKPELILQEGKLKAYNGKIDDIDVVEILKIMNDRIEKLIDKDHKIGHSYFLGIETLDDLKKIFKDKVIPLLEEYFFGDFGKISLVLGSSFISKSGKSGVSFARNNEYDPSIANDLLERGVYEITTTDTWDFKSIYQ